jgi:hypothetical protein
MREQTRTSVTLAVTPFEKARSERFAETSIVGSL